jgi:DNA-binding transcriptional regulator YhcF (GntR family)
MMILHVDPDSTVPPYDQIRAQITTMATTGVLPADTRLPAIRQLAADLGLAAATVQRAYRELERDHVVRSRGRHGTFIQDPPAHLDPNEQDRRLAAAAHTYAVHARHLGVEPDHALTAARQALGELPA